MILTLSFVSRRGQQAPLLDVDMTERPVQSSIATEGPVQDWTKGKAQSYADSSEGSAQTHNFLTAETLHALSKSLVVRRVYFDSRKGRGHKTLLYSCSI